MLILMSFTQTIVLSNEHAGVRDKIKFQFIGMLRKNKKERRYFLTTSK